MRYLLLLVIMLGLGAGLFWMDDRSSPAKSSVPPAEFVIERSSDGHYYADGSVNGRLVRFLIDTGSSAVALSAKDADRIGIAHDPERYELIGKGASGIVRGSYMEVDELSVGGIAMEDREIAVVQGLETSLLGQPFLDSLGEVVIRNGQMILRP